MVLNLRVNYPDLWWNTFWRLFWMENDGERVKSSNIFKGNKDDGLWRKSRLKFLESRGLVGFQIDHFFGSKFGLMCSVAGDGCFLSWCWLWGFYRSIQPLPPPKKINNMERTYPGKFAGCWSITPPNIKRLLGTPPRKGWWVFKFDGFFLLLLSSMGIFRLAGGSSGQD